MNTKAHYDSSTTPETIRHSYYAWARDHSMVIDIGVYASIYRRAASDVLRITGRLSPQLEAMRALVDFCLSDPDPVTTDSHAECQQRIDALEQEIATLRARIPTPAQQHGLPW